ncbi:hypothetical protein TWF281_010518 [Arthrobotrys megalospora]
MDQRLESEDYTIGWICALAVEFKAALAILDERHPPLPQELDDNSYAFGRVGCYNIVIACLPSGVYGLTSATNVATLLRQSFPSITVGLMVGIGGGAPVLPLRDIRLGDVVVSEPVAGFPGILQYDFGKTIQEGQFVHTGVLNKPPNIFLKALTKLKAEYEPDSIAKIITNVLENGAVPQEFARPSIDQLFQPHYEHPLENASCVVCDHGMLVERPTRLSQDWPYVHYGLIASGNQVMKHGMTRDKLSRERGVLCFEMEAAGLDELPSLVIRGICDYADSHKNKEWQPYAALSAAAFARELLLQLPFRANVKSRPSLRVELSLPTAEEAVFGAYADQNEPECLPGTRIDLLNDIIQWADGSQRCMFWLVGRAGTGKSTISRTVARSFQENGQLGASFFFKRGEAERANGALLFTTIAIQLANRFRGMIPSIQTAIEADPSIPKKALREQFEKLIFRPLSEIKPLFNNPTSFHTSTSPKLRSIIVIDALDECEQRSDTNIIVNLLARLREIKTIDVRVFLTSRPEIPIRPAFKRLREDNYKEFILHEVSISNIKHDILLFLGHEMSKIREECQFSLEWPNDEKLHRLAEMAVPLFIYAATLCRFIGDGDPNEPIKTVLEYQTDLMSQPWRGANSRTGWKSSQIHKTYLPILDQLIVGRDAAEIDTLIKEFQEIVGAIVNLANPLSISSLAGLLSVSEITIECRLKTLHSVLNVPNDRHTPVRAFHASFRDFLLDHTLKEKSQFWIDEKISHQMVASKCIELMSGPRGLRRDICSLKSPGTLRAGVGKEIIESHIPSELRYACRYWVSHITQGGRLIDNDQALKFLRGYLLHWLEAMSLLGYMFETLSMVDSLISAIDEESDCLVPGPSTENGKNMSELLYDIRRFILRNRYIIDKAPLQIYYSAVVFLPTNSLLRHIFNPDKMLKQVCDLPKVDSEWDACLETLKGHDDDVSAIAFSSDGKLLASASCDGTIRLWDAAGSPLQTLEAHEHGVAALAFSPDSKSLASGSHDATVRLWEVTGAPLQVLEGHTGCVTAITFSSNGEFLVSASHDETVGVWNAATGMPLQILKGHTDTVNSIVFSSDGKVLASSSSDKTIILWDAITWMPLRTLEGHNNKVDAIAFSPDGNLLISLSSPTASTCTVIMWDAVIWAPLKMFECQDGVAAMAISPDSKYLALGSKGNSVLLLDTGTGTVLQTLEGHIHWVAAVAFSPNGKHLASGSADSDIKLWDITVRASSPSSNQEEHRAPVKWMELSPDGKLLLSVSLDGTGILWDAVSGMALRKLEGPCMNRGSGIRISFSSNGESLVTGRGPLDNTAKLWNVLTGKLRLTLQPDVMKANGQPRLVEVAISPNGRLLALVLSSLQSHVVELWDAAAGKLLQTNTRPLQTINSRVDAVSIVKFSPDCNFLALGSDNSTIRLWNITGATLAPMFQTLGGHNYNVRALVFSSDSKLLASASWQEVKIWDIATGVSLQTLGDYADIYSIAFSRNDKFLASVIEDKTIGLSLKLWDVATGTPLQTIAISRESYLLSFSPDGRYLNTDEQSFACLASIAPPGPCEGGLRRVVGIEGRWLVRGKEKLIWCPEQVYSSVVCGNVIALGYLSGRVSFFRFNVDV